MNYTFIYCFSCLIYCIICIIYNFHNERVTSQNNISALYVSRKEFLITFTIFCALTFLAPSIILFGLRKCFVCNFLAESELMLLSMLISQMFTLVFVYSLKRYLKLSDSEISLKQSITIGLNNFGCILPIILLVSCLWLAILLFLRNCGIDIAFDEQSVVVLFSKIHRPLFKVIFFILAVFVAPFIEEYVFRAGIYRILKGVMTIKLASIWTSVMFAVLHFNLVSFVPLFVLSYLLVRSYERYNNICVLIVVHGAFNFNSVMLMLISTGM